MLAEAEARGWTISAIWNTHWHPDHTGGNAEIKAATGCTIIGPEAEAGRIPTLDVQVKGGDTVRLGAVEAEVIDVPAHTAGHIAYHFADRAGGFSSATRCSRWVAAGCSKARPMQMFRNMRRLEALPGDTTRLLRARIYPVATAATRSSPSRKTPIFATA